MEQQNKNLLNIALKSDGYKRLVKRRIHRYGIAFLISLVAICMSIYYGFDDPLYFILTGIATIISIAFLIWLFSSMKKPTYANSGWIEDVHFRVHKLKKKKNEEKKKYHYEYAIKDNDKVIWARCLDSKDSLNEQTKAINEEVIFFRYGKDEWFCISYFGKINNIAQENVPVQEKDNASDVLTDEESRETDPSPKQ